MGAEMKQGGRHGIIAAGLARRAVRNDRRGRDLRSGDPARERRVRKSSDATTPEQRAGFEDKLSVVRRLILACAVAILASLGYWLGNILGGFGGVRG